MSGVSHGIAWSDSYALGNEQVDAQHRQLFALLSDLVEACTDGSGAQKVGEALNFLVNYTVRHFEDEEALQLRYNYPGYDAHKQIHEDFKVSVGRLVNRYVASGSSEELSVDLNKIVVRWLVNHIQQEDQRIGEHIRRLEGR